MAKKRIFITLSALILVLLFSAMSYALKGPVLENNDELTKIGDYYVMADGNIHFTKLGSSTNIKIRKAGHEGDLQLIYADECNRDTVTGDWLCKKCPNADGSTSEDRILKSCSSIFNCNVIYEFKACDQTFYETRDRQPNIENKDVTIPVKAGDVIKVYLLPDDISKSDIAYRTTEQIMDPLCIDSNGEISDNTIPITTAANTITKVTIGPDTPLKHVRLMYLGKITAGDLPAIKRVRVMKTSYFNLKFSNKMNFGIGDTASWTDCNNDKCDSAGTLIPHAIWYQKDPSKWDELTLDKIMLDIQSIGADKFKFCVISGCDEAAEEKCNGRDDNCDGKIDEGCDSDKDGYVDAGLPCTDSAKCADDSGNAMTCSCGAADNPCCKVDISGISVGTDCNDDDIKINHDAEELCFPDTANNDCDAEINEGCSSNQGDCENPDTYNGKWVGPNDLGECCGETTDPDADTPDSQEYFSKWIDSIDSVSNNIDSACWASKPVTNLDIADKETNKSLHYNGSFYGCDISPEYGSIKNTEHPAENIISQNIIAGQSCTNEGDDTLGYYYCSYAGTWKSVNKLKSDIVKRDPTVSSSECCPKDYCWNGTECIDGSDPSATGPDYDNSNLRKKCILGEWQDVILKPDQTGNPYNAKECGITQCNYFDGSGNSCVEDGFWEAGYDYYCLQGNWTTRTAILANQLVSMAESASASEYTLFCDNYDRALNDLQYFEVHRTPPATAARYDIIGIEGDYDYIETANKFCVINYKDGLSYRTVVGASLNVPVNDSSSSLLKIFEESEKNNPQIDTQLEDFHYNYCDGAIARQGETKTDSFIGCNYLHYVDGKDKAKMWYNAKNDMIIYSKEDINPSEPTLLDSFIRAIVSPINYIKGIFSGPDTASQDFISTSKFDRLYINKKGEKAIRGYVDEDAQQMSIVYENIKTDVCEIAGQFLHNNGILAGYESDYMTCDLGFSENENIVYHIESRNSDIVGEAGGIQSQVFWPDMTAKIRLDDSAVTSLNQNHYLISDIQATPITTNPDVENAYGFPVHFTATLGADINPDDIWFYYWVFGDGTTDSSTKQKTDFDYRYRPGTYEYTLKVVDKNLDYDEHTKTIPIPGLEEGNDCGYDWQCDSKFCNPDTKVCSQSSCTDSYKGPEETDADCGGYCSALGFKCDLEKACGMDDDCKSNICDETDKVCVSSFACSVRDIPCDMAKTLLFKLSGTTNAHAELWSESNYKYYVCCGLKNDIIHADCSDNIINNNAVMFRLSDKTNAHAEESTFNDYTYNVCMSSSKGTIACQYKNSCDDNTEACVVSLSADKNAHVGDCSAYPNKVCCNKV